MTNAKLAKRILADYVEPHAIDLIEPAFSGDADAALALSVGHEKMQRGVIARICYEGGMPKKPFREVLGSIWDSNHKFVMNAARSHERVRLMFKYAKFPIPKELPETIQVWRGASGISVNEARQGFSWTTDRNVACWFAIQMDSVGKPLVITAKIPKRDVLYYSNNRTEQELLLLNPPKKAAIDGSEEDWKSGCLARIAEVENSNKRELKEAEGTRDNPPVKNNCQIVPAPEPWALLEYLNHTDANYGLQVRLCGMPRIDHQSTDEALEAYAQHVNQLYSSFIKAETNRFKGCSLTEEDILAQKHDQIVSITACVTGRAQIENFETCEELFAAIKERSSDQYLLITKAVLMISGSAYEPRQTLLSEIFDRITKLKSDPKQWKDAVSKGAILLNTTRSRQEKIEALLKYVSLLNEYQRAFGISQSGANPNPERG